METTILWEEENTSKEPNFYCDHLEHMNGTSKFLAEKKPCKPL